MRQLSQQEMNCVGGGHSHKDDGMSTTAVKTVMMAGSGFFAGFLTQKYLERAGVAAKMTTTLAVGVASTVSAFTCLGIGMGVQYIHLSENHIE